MRIPSNTITSQTAEPEADTAPTPLARGARGEAVKAAQNQLLDAGYSLTRWGADGAFGAETARAVRRFQTANALPVTGRFDAATFKALETAKSAAPDYDALFADGQVKGVLAIGFDETGAQEVEQANVLRGLSERGFTHVTDDQRAALGLDAEGAFVTRNVVRDGERVPVVLELITPDTQNAKARFAEAMRTDELIIYGGHGRYGSGPDFDDIRSPAGNFVIGAPFEAGHVTLGTNDLSAEKLTERYQLMFFDGCNTYRYLDDLRSRTPGKTEKNLDVIGSTTELYWHTTARNLLAMVDTVTDRGDVQSLRAKLDGINDLEHAFVADGFDDNVRPA